MRTRLLGTALALALLVSGSSSAAEARERILYVAEPSGVSLYDIENGHAFLRRIEVPGTANYKGIGSSPALSRLFLSSKKGHELVGGDEGAGEGELQGDLAGRPTRRRAGTRWGTWRTTPRPVRRPVRAGAASWFREWGACWPGSPR